MYKLITIFFLAIILTGCVQNIVKEIRPYAGKTISTEEEIIEKTALLSFTEFFCYWTEQSQPVAYFQFAYQEYGSIQYVKTKTTCDDLEKLGITNDAGKNPTLFGEQIKLHFKEGTPFKITRENGDVYEIEQCEKIRSFFTSGINKYENLKYCRNSHSEKVILECLSIKDINQHDRCLSFQAAFQLDIGICDKIKNLSTRELCKQWVNNIKENKINK